MGPWMRKLQVDLTNTKHDEMSLYSQSMLQEMWYRGPFMYENGYEMRKCIWYGRETRFQPYCYVSRKGNVPSTVGNAFQGCMTHVSSLTCGFFNIYIYIFLIYF